MSSSSAGRTKPRTLFGFGFPVLCVPFDSFLFVDDAVELMAHASRLSLGLDLIAVDGAAALRERTRAIAALYGAGE